MMQPYSHESLLAQFRSARRVVRESQGNISLVKTQALPQKQEAPYQIIQLLMCMDLLALVSAVVCLYTFNLVSSPAVFGFAVLFYTASTTITRLYDLSTGQYMVGKFACIGVLGLLIEALAFAFLQVEPGAMLSAFGLQLAIMTMLCVGHHVISKPYAQADTTSVYCKTELYIKTVLDWTVCAVGLLATAPLIAVVSALVWYEDRGSIFFGQTRIGLNENSFKMFKFRSMSSNSERLTPVSTDNSPELFKMVDDPRITKVGKLIRKLSIDEVPQLLNVLRGEMSLVGPRPPLPHEFAKMSRNHRLKFRVKPGITGYWQVTGRVKNERSFNAVAYYDNHYIDNWCLLEDLKILFATIPVVLFQKGAC